MRLYRELERRERAGDSIRVAVCGIGSMGRGIASQVQVMNGMRPALLANRTPDRAVQTYVDIGARRSDIVVSDDPDVLDRAVRRGCPAVTGDACAAALVRSIEVVVEATGTVEHAARVGLVAIEAGKHLVVMNAELDSKIGCLLAEKARAASVVYTYADGDQPGVLIRLIEWVRVTGFEVVAAVNCKGYLDARATPDDIRSWAERMRTSPAMVCTFTDGTKMNMENAVVCNASGLVPEKRGMHGVATNLRDCLADFERVLHTRGVVDYTLGGDFAGGVLVIGRNENALVAGHYLDYLKLGSGPQYLFYRPYHLCHIEAPLSVAEAVIDGEATAAPLGAPIADVVALAKRDLRPGDILDGIGGTTCFGQIDRAENARDLLPMGLADGVRVTAPIGAGQPIPHRAVELDPGNLVVRLRAEQDRMIANRGGRVVRRAAA